jgi:hypothetical protein
MGFRKNDVDSIVWTVERPSYGALKTCMIILTKPMPKSHLFSQDGRKIDLTKREWSY